MFEEKYNVDIEDFSTTEEIDKLVEKKAGKKLEVVLFGEKIVSKRGDVLPSLDKDVDSEIDKALKKK